MVLEKLFDVFVSSILIPAVSKIVFTSRYPISIRGNLKDFHKPESTYRLMRHYADGFKLFRLYAGSRFASNESIMRVIRNAINISNIEYGREQENKHRIAAYPFCLAINLMPFLKTEETDYEDTLGEIGAKISLGFGEHPEIHEIVFQNMVCSLIYDEHSWKNFRLPDELFRTIANHFAMRTEFLHNIVSSNIALQFLMYYEHALKRTQGSEGLRGGDIVNSHTTKIHSLFDTIKSENCEFDWFNKKWLESISKHCNSFGGIVADKGYSFFAPQTSEIVLGWKFEEYSSILPVATCNNALIFHWNRLIAEDELDPERYSKGYKKITAESVGVRYANWFSDIGYPPEKLEKIANEVPEPLSDGLRIEANVVRESSGPSEKAIEVIRFVPFRAAFDVRTSMGQEDAYKKIVHGLEKDGLSHIWKSGSDVTILLKKWWHRFLPDKTLPFNEENVHEELEKPETQKEMGQLQELHEGNEDLILGEKSNTDIQIHEQDAEDPCTQNEDT